MINEIIRKSDRHRHILPLFGATIYFWIYLSRNEKCVSITKWVHEDNYNHILKHETKKLLHEMVFFMIGYTVIHFKFFYIVWQPKKKKSS